MTKLILTDWAFNNCLFDKAPNGFIPWGYAVVRETKDIYRTIKGDVVAETEKAVCIKYRADLCDSRCNVYKSIDWKCWIPKSQLVTVEVDEFFDGGQYQLVEEYLEV